MAWRLDARQSSPSSPNGLSGLSLDLSLSATLIAVLVAVTDDEPRVLTVGQARSLPSGPFAVTDRSLQTSLRAWVEQQTGHPLGYVEQLYTFADRNRACTPGEPSGGPAIAISYLGLTREAQVPEGLAATWQSWYRYFPWEDRRAGSGGIPPALLAGLHAWAASDPAQAERVALTFGAPHMSVEGPAWNEELALQRYEILYEAGLVPESPNPSPDPAAGGSPAPGAAMLHDHRRILATAMARLRAKIKYRPVIFELMPETFTLLHLQRVFEAVAGRLLHKQNFRRLVEQQGLVEETGALAFDTGGRPAKLHRFKRSVLQERAVSGTKLPLAPSR